MTRTKPYKRVESAEGRARCAIHAASELLTWEHPGSPDDWAPTARQIIDRTRQLYGWVEINETEALTALEAVQARHVAA